MSVKVLIVDDNAMYRTAFKRNLMLRDYEVIEAENGDEAMTLVQQSTPDVIVTDLNMRTPDEGLELIRNVKQAEPLIPIVMISAVGTFEEGAEASRLGAHSVISKSRIDDEIESLYRTIDSARTAGEHNRGVLDEVGRMASAVAEGTPPNLQRLREIVADNKLHAIVRAEAYDLLLAQTEGELRGKLEEKIRGADMRDLEGAEKDLKVEIPEFDTFEEATRKEVRTAEYFFRLQGGDRPSAGADFSRNIGFSFCFAVENEAKSRLRKRLHRFLTNPDAIKTVKKLIDQKSGQLDLFYHQHLARIQQSKSFDFTIDNVRQVFQRILEHESRYKPDGLKALGIMILCFGRDYKIKTHRETIEIHNPLALKGFESDEDVIDFAHLLVSLQHYRNPYIHPEISEMEKISNIRNAAIRCLRQIARLT